MTSYVIARTLGDATASTSHKSSFAAQLVPPKSDSKIANTVNSTGPPTVLGGDPDPDRGSISIPLAVSPQEDESPTGTSTKPATPTSTAAAPGTDTGSSATSSRAFFVDGEEGSEDDGAARLAGVGVFSPVASMPASPTVSRRDFFEKDGEDGGGGSGSSVASGTDESGSPFAAPRGVLLRSSGGMHHQHHHQQHPHQHHQGGREAETEQEPEPEHEYGHEHENSPRSASDGGGANGAGSTSGESSFAILDREESFEDAGVHIRRRVPGGAGADE